MTPAPVDPLKLPLEELLYIRLGQFMDQLAGRRVPGLYKVLTEQMDRAVLRQALERSAGQLSTAAQFLDMDRNTLARKVRKLKVPVPDSSNPGGAVVPPRSGRSGSSK